MSASTVADILSQMAENASRRQMYRGAVIGNTISQASQVPAQFIEDRRRQAVVDLEQRQRQQQLQYAGNADARAQEDQARQNEAAQHDLLEKKIAAEIINAYTGGTPNDPTTNNLQAGQQRARELGRGDWVMKLAEIDRNEKTGKVTQLDPTKDTYVNGVLTKPGVKPLKTEPHDLAVLAQNPNPFVRTLADSALTRLERPKGAGTVHDTPNGLVRINPDNSVTPLGVQGYHPPKAADPNAVPPPVDLEKLPQTILDQAKALVEGRRQLDPRMANKPLGQTIINAAYALDPSFDQGNYNARYKARTDLTNPGGTGGKTIGALNTAIQHAGKLSDLIEKLDNFESPLINAVVNPMRTAAGSTKVTNFDTVAPQLAKEIERVWRGAGGTAGEIHDLIETIGHNKGKQQQREALQQFVELAKGKLDSLEQQRDNVMGKTVGATIPILFDQNKPIIETIAQRAGGQASGAASGPVVGTTRTVNGETRRWNGQAWEPVK